MSEYQRHGTAYSILTTGMICYIYNFCRYSRTLNEVRETLELAVIKESGLRNVTQVLHSTSESDANRRTKLLELDEHLLATIKEGDRYIVTEIFKYSLNRSLIFA